MKYLVLCYYDVEAFERLTAADGARIGEACKPHDAALSATGKVLATGSLTLPAQWTTIVPEGGGPAARPGPYLEGRHQAGAFLIVEADSDAEARRIASLHAAANVGADLGFAVEVRGCEMYRDG